MCFHHLSSDIVSWLTLFISFLVLIIAFVQFRRLINDKKVEFTYKAYSDFFSYLNDKENEEEKCSENNKARFDGRERHRGGRYEEYRNKKNENLKDVKRNGIEN